MLQSLRFLALLLATTGFLVAQNTQVFLKIEPTGNPLIVEMNKPVQFTAKAYIAIPGTTTGREVQIDKLAWSVDPATFGTIDQKGVFVAYGSSGGLITDGRIVAHAEVAGITVQGVVSARVGIKPPDTQFEFTISGSVKDANGDPIVGAEIVAVSPNSPITLHLATKTDANGEYKLKVPAGTYYIEASAHGYLSEYYDNAFSLKTATLIKTDPQTKDITGIDFVLGSGGSISGQVVDKSSGKPLAEVTLIAFSKTGSGTPGGSNLPGYYARTDAQGNYKITGMAEGDYFIQATAGGYQVQYYDKVASQQLATTVTVKAGGSTPDINFEMEKEIIITPDLYEISGTVYDANGNTVTYAIITAEAAATTPIGVKTYYAKSDGNGDYTLKVHAGSYIVSAQAQGFVKEYYNNVATRDLATKVSVDASNPSAAGIDFSLGTGGGIAGTVTDAAINAPIKGASVSIMSSRNSGGIPGTNNFSAQTDEQGNYKISGLAAGKYIVMARKEGFALQYYDHVADYTLATEVEVIGEQTTSGIDFSLGKLAGISGTVTDAATSNPIPKAEVVAEGNGVRFAAHTNEHGEYTLPLPAGTYTVRASSYKYATEWYNEKADATQADPVTLSSTPVDNINFTLETWGGRIKGIVVDAQSNPIEGALVKVWVEGKSASANNLRYYAQAKTAADGSYEVSGIPPGKYLVMASAKGFIGEFFDGVTDITLATTVSVQNQQTTDGINFTLDAGGAITGTVVDSKTNKPIASALVTIRSSATLSEMAAKTDEQGNYTITGLATGDYYLFAVAHGYLGKYYQLDPTQHTPVHVDAPNTTTGIDFALDPAVKQGRYRYTGTVVDAVTRQDLSLSLVELVSTSHAKILTTTTSQNGRFELLSDEQMTIRARAIGYIGTYSGNKRNWMESTPLLNGGEVNFELEKSSEVGFASITGKVLDAKTNAPMTDAWVFGIDVEGNTFFAVTDQNGSYRMGGLSNGSLDVFISETSYQPTQNGTSVDGVSMEMNLSARRNETTTASQTPIPTTVSLSQNYPNPFNPTTSISYDIPASGHASLKVFNLIGKEIATLVSGIKEAGSYRVTWNAENVPSGVYLYKLETNGKTLTRQMILMK